MIGGIEEVFAFEREDLAEIIVVTFGFHAQKEYYECNTDPILCFHVSKLIDALIYNSTAKVERLVR